MIVVCGDPFAEGMRKELENSYSIYQKADVWTKPPQVYIKSLKLMTQSRNVSRKLSQFTQQ